MPGLWQAWPKSAAFWSPAMPPMISGSPTAPAALGVAAPGPDFLGSPEGRRGAPVLPPDRVMGRRAGRAVPQERRLARVGGAPRHDVFQRDVRLAHRLACGLALRAENLLGI